MWRESERRDGIVGDFGDGELTWCRSTSVGIGREKGAQDMKYLTSRARGSLWSCAQLYLQSMGCVVTVVVNDAGADKNRPYY
jgi:hypothetical protein